jgi:hypothetical protein
MSSVSGRIAGGMGGSSSPGAQVSDARPGPLRWLVAGQSLLAVKPNVVVIAAVFGPLSVVTADKNPAVAVQYILMAALAVAAPLVGLGYATRFPSRGRLWTAMFLLEWLLLFGAITGVLGGETSHGFGTADAHGCRYRGPADYAFCGTSDVMTSATGFSWLPGGMVLALSSACCALVLMVRQRRRL